MQSHVLLSLGAAGVLFASDTRAQVADRAPHAIRWLARGDARLEYLDFGGPVTRTIVLVPGYGDNAHVYDDLAPLLVRHAHVLALTPRGHGASSTPSSGYTIRAFADDIGALLDELRAQRAVLVGHSAAGGTITGFAVRHPGRTQGLVYLDATLDFIGRDSVLAANPVPRPAPTDSTPEGARLWYRHVFYGFWSDALEHAMRSRSADAAARNRPSLLSQLLRDLSTHPPEYHDVRAPALIVTAKKTVDANYPWLRGASESASRTTAQRYLDSVLNPWYAAGARRAQRELSRSSVVHLLGHHYIFITSQAQVAEQIVRFTASVYSSPPAR
jgi:pimeloyl-ACP methyl ester carboxylesterase